MGAIFFLWRSSPGKNPGNIQRGRQAAGGGSPSASPWADHGDESRTYVPEQEGKIGVGFLHLLNRSPGCGALLFREAVRVPVQQPARPVSWDAVRDQPAGEALSVDLAYRTPLRAGQPIGYVKR